MVCRLFTASAENINFAFRDPLFGRALAPAALHLAVVFVVLVGVAYGLMHLLLVRYASGSVAIAAELPARSEPAATIAG